MSDLYTSTVLDFIGELLTRKYKTFETDEELDSFFECLIVDFYNSTTLEEQETLEYYTSRIYSSINDVLRDKWVYEVNGRLTPEDKAYYQKTAEEIERIIGKVGTLPSNIKTYRICGMHPFWSHGIYDVKDLVKMKGEYIFERGFLSTSIKKSSLRYVDKNYFGKRNVVIEFLIPEESKDGIPLTISGFSYYTEESEYLINKDSLIKIVDVKVEGDNAYLQAVLLPRRVWDRPYEIQEERK